METAKQLSVSLVNKPGRFSAILNALTKEKVSTRAFCVMDSGNRGTLRFVPDDPSLAVSALESLNVKFDMADVLIVNVPSQPGGLRKICQRLADEHLNIDYAYGSLNMAGGAKSGNLAVIKVNDLVKAQRVLSDAVGMNGAKPKRRPGRRPAHAR